MQQKEDNPAVVPSSPVGNNFFCCTKHRYIDEVHILATTSNHNQRQEGRA